HLALLFRYLWLTRWARPCGWGSSRPVALLTTPPEARMPRGGVRRRCGRRGPVGGDRVRRSAAATLDACRSRQTTSATAPVGGTLRSRGGGDLRRCLI
ncbi:unnamed protein product, partial [Pleuronectes platessa]